MRFTTLIIKMPADPFEYVVALRRIGNERCPVNRDETAATFHLFTKDFHPFADEHRMIFGATITSAADQYDGVGRIERRFVFGPPVEVNLARQSTKIGRRFQTVLEKLDRSLVFVRPSRMVRIFCPRNEDDFFHSLHR